jgi:hypothetical protein
LVADPGPGAHCRSDQRGAAAPAWLLKPALYGVIHQLEALGLQLLEIRSRPSTRHG